MPTLPVRFIMNNKKEMKFLDRNITLKSSEHGYISSNLTRKLGRLNKSIGYVLNEAQKHPNFNWPRHLAERLKKANNFKNNFKKQ